MPRSPYLGELEMAVLLVLTRLGAPTDGMTVYDEILRSTGREMSAPTVYITLARLVRKEYVEVLPRRPAGSGGRPRKLFKLTAAGRRQARERSRRLLSFLSPATSRGTR